MVADVIRRRWVTLPRSSGTEEAESGLGITGEPLYFYAMRPEHAFGFVVFALRLAVRPDTGVRGATPFDSGGLWIGEVRAPRALAAPERRDLFRKHDVPLAAFPDMFERYANANYDTLDDYVEGRPPRTGTPPITPGHPNASRAWTWEVRIPRGVANRWAELVGGFITPAAMNEFGDWLSYESAIEDAEAERVLRWVSARMRLAPPGLSASEFAKEAMLAGAIA